MGPLLCYNQAREFLSKLGDLSQTQIFAKIENVEVSFSVVVTQISLPLLFRCRVHRESLAILLEFELIHVFLILLRV